MDTDTSYLLARVIGVILALIYGSILFNEKYFKSVWEDWAKNPFFIFLTGFINLLLGLLIIEFHNIWAANWRVIITLVGWILAISGIWRIIFPEALMRFGRRLFEESYAITRGISIILFLVGLYLIYMGFFW